MNGRRTRRRTSDTGAVVTTCCSRQQASQLDCLTRESPWGQSDPAAGYSPRPRRRTGTYGSTILMSTEKVGGAGRNAAAPLPAALGVVREVHRRDDVLAPGLAAAVMHQTIGAPSKGPPTLPSFVGTPRWSSRSSRAVRSRRTPVVHGPASPFGVNCIRMPPTVVADTRESAGYRASRRSRCARDLTASAGRRGRALREHPPSFGRMVACTVEGTTPGISMCAARGLVENQVRRSSRGRGKSLTPSRSARTRTAARSTIGNTQTTVPSRPRRGVDCQAARRHDTDHRTRCRAGGCDASELTRSPGGRSSGGRPCECAIRGGRCGRLRRDPRTRSR